MTFNINVRVLMVLMVAAALSLASFHVADARRTQHTKLAALQKKHGAPGGEKFKCTMLGPATTKDGEARLSVSFPVKKCNFECMTGVVNDKVQIGRQYPKAFTELRPFVDKDGVYCTCFVNGEMKVKFRLGGMPQADCTVSNPAASEPNKAQELCWHWYKKSSSTNVETRVLSTGQEVAINGVVDYTKYRDTLFDIGPPTCTETRCPEPESDCYEFAFGAISDHLDGKARRAIGAAGDLTPSKANDRGADLQALMEMFTPDDWFAIDFAKIDTDDDGLIGFADLVEAHGGTPRSEEDLRFHAGRAGWDGTSPIDLAMYRGIRKSMDAGIWMWIPHEKVEAIQYMLEGHEE